MSISETSQVSSEQLPAPWTFNARGGVDSAFHPLVSRFGSDVIMDLDEIVLDNPLQAAMHATKVFQHYQAQAGNENAATDTRNLMNALAEALKPNAHLLDEQALVPPEAVFRGFSRPKG